MKHMALTVVAACLAIVFIVVYSCRTETQDEKESRLAHKWCASCHLFPEPSLLTRSIWLTHTLPEMAFRMGLDPVRPRPTSGGKDLGVIPVKPLVSPEDFELIKNYYAKNSPDSLPRLRDTASLTLDQFSVSEIKVNRDLPLFCLIQVDTLRHLIYAGNRNSRLYELTAKGALVDSFRLISPPSHLVFEPGQHIIVSSMGIMDPNDETRGRIFMIDAARRHAYDYIDSLQRPVFFEKRDLNGDHLDDYVVCEFGNFTGGLRVYENLGNDKFRYHSILDIPGARKVMIRDVDHDGKPDLLALFSQGNEQLSIFINTGNFNFDMKTILRFPPVNGSSFFDLVDFDHDGKEDILYTNGDNLDYSPMLKQFHGVHIFRNEGDWKFKETWFHTMYGASMAMARDFDDDGDIDIAAISFFPDFNHTPEKGFIYFENTGHEFIPHTTPLARDGRWLVMDVADIDGDGDDDIVLGALDFQIGDAALFQTWQQKKTGILIFSNSLK